MLAYTYSPHHGMRFTSRNDGLKCVSMTWRAISAGPDPADRVQSVVRLHAVLHCADILPRIAGGNQGRAFKPCTYISSLDQSQLGIQPGHVAATLSLNSVSGLATKMWYRIPFDQSELSISKLPPTHSPKVRPGRDSRETVPRCRGDKTD
jgi:hypothetical protein